MILNDITQDNNKVLEDESNKTVKFHRLEMSMWEDVSTLKSVAEVEQRNGGPQKKRLLVENENTARKSNEEQGMDQATNRPKIFGV